MGRSDAKTNRVGERFITNEGYIVEIVEYNRNDDLWIEFQDEHKARVHTTYKHCKSKSVKNPFHPSVFEIGFVGIGEYKPSENGKMSGCYTHWFSMMTRCYDSKHHEKHPTYIECTVCKEWHNFQVFALWYEENFYEIGNEVMQLDKDILVKGNKVYSPDTCIFVPQRINKLFTKRDNDRGEFPVGVTFYKGNTSKKYMAYCNVNGKSKYLGLYNTPEKAFEVYKQFKEAYIKEVADEYKDRIPKELYDAMYAWEVEIDD